MSKIFAPTNQIRLTNVAVVRLKKTGKRFEIACYKNKVIDYRDGTEKDLGNVLQSTTVFSNVSRGQVAKKEDLHEAFNTTDSEQICIEILRKGELQVSEKERSEHHDNLFKEIAQIVSDKCVDPSNQRQYPSTVIEKAMKELQYNINTRKNAKKQALDVIKLIQEKEVLPLQKAKMKLRVNIPGTGDVKSCRNRIHELMEEVLVDEFKNKRIEIIGFADPGSYRILQDYVSTETKGKGNVEIMSLKEISGLDEIV